MTTIEGDRDAVRTLLLKAEAQLSDGDPDAKAANRTTAEMEKIAEHWEAEGHLVDLLSPLLTEDQDKVVRFGAASFLISRGHSDLAEPVLESLDLVKAKIVLNYWRRQHQT